MRKTPESEPRKKHVGEGLSEAMRPQPFPVEGIGLQLYATPSDLANLQEALDEEGLLVVMNRLLRADLSAIAAAAQHCLMNSDRTPWSGHVDELPVSAMELGRLFADAVHRRLMGEELQIEKPVKGAIESRHPRAFKGAADA